MFNTIFNRGSLPYMEQILHFTRARHNAIASNIANIETPTYKAIDAPVDDFKEALKVAVRQQNKRHVPVFEMVRKHNVAPKPGGGLNVSYVELEPGQFLKHDENNVDIDEEMVKLRKNTGLHNTMAALIAHQFDMLSTAIRGRAS